jgi:hypothetical protein
MIAMHPSEWDALRAEDEQDYRDRTGPYAPGGRRAYPRQDHRLGVDDGAEYKLAAQVERLEHTVRDLERDTVERAERALTRYRTLTDESDLDPDTAVDRVVSETRRAVGEQPGTQYRYVTVEIDDDDRRRASGEFRRLLDRVAAAELALTRLGRESERAAEAAIGLFREYRDVHGRDDEAAAAQALRDISEATQASHDLAVYDIDRRDSGAADSMVNGDEVD